MYLLQTASFGDHPRVCGEKFGDCPRDQLAPRITPAYAGKSASPLVWRLPHRDHPRVCGEKTVSQLLLSALKGSPPRMRGKVCTRTARPPSVRITPAYAGKRRAVDNAVVVFRDHPRVCGEKDLREIAAALIRGSPPRMRGKAHRKSLRGVLCRITPAYAGKSPLYRDFGISYEDHPRVCGEK